MVTLQTSLSKERLIGSACCDSITDSSLRRKVQVEHLKQHNSCQLPRCTQQGRPTPSQQAGALWIGPQQEMAQVTAESAITSEQLLTGVLSAPGQHLL